MEIANTAHYPARKRRYMGSQERELATIKSHRAIEEMCFPMIFADMGKEKTMQMNRMEHERLEIERRWNRRCENV